MALTTTPTNDLSINKIGGISGLSGAEISAYDPASKRLFTTSSSGLQIIDLSDPAAPTLIVKLDLTTAANGSHNSTDLTSVAAKNGIVAVAIPDNSVPADDSDKANSGKVAFFEAATGNYLGSVTVGAHPDMLTFTPDGTKILVANEGELASTPGVNGEGSVSIIDISGGVASATVTQARFTGFDGQEDSLRAAGVRITAGVAASLDFEPEYIAISPDGATAVVTLQENNAIAFLDIATATFTSVVPLGLKDWSLPGNVLDAGDRDGAGNTTATNIQNWPIFSMYMPDAIASFASGGQTYYVMANEGDDRDDFLASAETIRVGAGGYDLDNTLFPNESALKTNAQLGRLTVSKLDGDTDGDGDYDKIVAYGGRSFSIVDSNGNRVFDSAGIIEQIIAATTPTLHNADANNPAQIDTRSDNKGPEPESVTVATINGRTYAFVAIERSGGGAMVFDVTDPANVTFTTYAYDSADVSPEGTLFISAADSPNGKDLLVLSNEVSNTVGVYQTTSNLPAYTLQLLHFSDGEAGLLAGDTAPNLAALVDAFDDAYANTIILSGGDNFLPGPFVAAGTDPSVGATHTRGTNFGAADIEIHNIIGVQASTIGNHEFDLGTTAFSDAVADTNFPYLSANLDFSGDSSLRTRYQETVGTGGLEEASDLKGKIVPSAVITQGGEKIGLVGATTQIVERISSTGGVEVKGFAGDGAEVDDMVLLAAQLQLVIDELIAQGVNKIILMAHLQDINNEKTLAGLLHGVDIILSAGSNTRLGDADDTAVEFPGHAANFADSYPLVMTDADGKTTLIVNTDNEYTYLGRLVVDFDAEGNIILDSVTQNASINGAYASTDENVATAWNTTVDNLDATAFAEGTKGDKVRTITEAVDAVIAAKDGQLFGYTDVYLEGERAFVRAQETNLGDISADANLYAASQALGDTQPFMISIKNGGGIRAQIGAIDFVTGEKIPPIANDDAGKPEGAVSKLDIENALRFDNRLMMFDTTAAELKNILEFTATLAPGNGGFPQLGGLRYSFDRTKPAGQRVQNISLIDDNGEVIARVVENGVVSANAPAVISAVILNFTANGGDGYPIKANGTNFRYLLNDGTVTAAVDESLDFTLETTMQTVGASNATLLGEQQAFQEYMLAYHGTPETAYDVADTPEALDMRIQNLAVRSDAVFLGKTYNGDDTDETIAGTAGDDTLNGGGGNDTLDGKGGHDVLAGGAGNDTYIFTNTGETIVELPGEGVDTIISAVATPLPGNVENFVYTGAAGAYLFGNSADNALTGGAATDRLYGLGGNDTLDGGGGGDYLIGGAGDDVYLVRSAGDVVIEALNEGNDTVISDVSHVLRANVENLTLAEGAAVNATGNALDNVLIGNGITNRLYGLGGNDTLDGGGAGDYLIGGAGDDTYIVDNVGDVVIELAGEGVDTVISTVSHTLRANVENLTLAGDASINGVGNELDNIIIGNGATNRLYGMDGNDTLIGGGGRDYLIAGAGNDTLDSGGGGDYLTGGAGDDTYFVHAGGDVIVEAVDGGNDTVISDTIYALGANIENLILIGDAYVGYGNGGDNVLTGSAAANRLDGGAGNDRLIGGGGHDLLIGGSGNDIFVLSPHAEDSDEILDFVGGVDNVEISAASFGAGLAAGNLSGLQFIANANGNAATGGDASTRFIYNTTNGQLFFDADGTGEASATLIARLQGAPALAASDFKIV